MKKVEYNMGTTRPSAEFEIELLDEEGSPLANVDYKIIFEGGLVLTGTTDGDGMARHGKVPDEEFDIILQSDREAD